MVRKVEQNGWKYNGLDKINDTNKGREKDEIGFMIRKAGEISEVDKFLWVYYSCLTRIDLFH